MITLVIATRNAHKVAEIRAILGGNIRCLDLTFLPGAPEVVEDAATFEGNATKKAVALARWLGEQRASSFAKATEDKEDGRQRTENGGQRTRNKQEQKAIRTCRAEAARRRRNTQHATRLTSPVPPRKPWQALEASKVTHVLADDSGLEVDALKGAPGVHSARFAALDSGQPGNSSSEANNTTLLRLLEGVPVSKRTAQFRCVLALTPAYREGRTTASPVCLSDELELQTELFDGVCLGTIGFKERGRGGFGYDPLFFPAGYDQTFGELPAEAKNKLSHRAKALEKLKMYLLR